MTISSLYKVSSLARYFHFPFYELLYSSFLFLGALRLSRHASAFHVRYAGVRSFEAKYKFTSVELKAAQEDLGKTVAQFAEAVNRA